MLQLVLQSCRANKLKVDFNQLGTVLNLCLTIRQTSQRGLVQLVPRVIVLFTHGLLDDDEGSKALACKVIHVSLCLLNKLAHAWVILVPYQGEKHRVGTLAHYDDTTRRSLAENRGHTLASGAKLD